MGSVLFWVAAFFGTVFFRDRVCLVLCQSGDNINDDFPDLPADFDDPEEWVYDEDDDLFCEDVRYLPPMTADAFYQLYRDKGGTASKTCFDATWKEFPKLKVRKETDQGKRNDCIRLKLNREQAKTPHDIRVANEDHKAHLDDMFLDRVVDSRITALSVAATDEHSSVLATHDVGSMAIDAMDQSKFRVPRGGLATKAKEVQGLWKPALHVIGCIFDGVREDVYVADPNLVKDANCALTCLSATLHKASETLDARDKSVPLQLHIRSDNGNAEAKNQTACKYASWMVTRRALSSMVLGQLRPGHSHFRADQMCSTIGEEVKNKSNAKTVEDPTTFVEIIGGIKNKNAGKLNATYDRKDFFHHGM